jgi:hypothetical protein
MNNLLSISTLNNYSKLVFNNKKSVLDAAFDLLLDSDYNENISSEKFKIHTYKFIIHVYVIIYLQLLDDSDNILYLSGYNNELKLFAYNIIYLFDNLDDTTYNNIIDHNQTTLYTATFNYIISDYLFNCSNTNDNDNSADETQITSWISENYDYENLIEPFDIDNFEIWQINIYVVCYNYVCLVEDIKNMNLTPIFLVNIKNYLNSCIIVHCINQIIKDTENREEIDDFLENNPYFSDIIDKVQDIFYNDDTIRFPITYCECFFNNYILENLYPSLIDYYTYKPLDERGPISKQRTREPNAGLDQVISTEKQNAKNINKLNLKFFISNQYDLCNAIDISNKDFLKEMDDIRIQVRIQVRKKPIMGGLKNFYIQFLNEVATNSNTINLIKNSSDIALLNKNFEECFYSLILDYHIRNGYISDPGYVNEYINDVITNLCNSINNINLNNKLNKKIKYISKKINNKNLVKYFFNDFSIYFKINQINEDENNGENNDEPDEYCDAFYLPNDLSLSNSGNVVLDEKNIIIGLFNLNKKNSPPIKLQTTIFFDTDPYQTYCLQNYTLHDSAIEFQK